MPELYSTTNLIINNIPSVISDEQLNKLFSKFGSIKSCKIIRSNEKDSKTFGFCEYNEPKSAKQALSQLDNFKLHDRILKVSYAKLFPKPKGKCIEVINLPKNTQEEVVRKHFSQFGRISRLRLLFNNANGNHTKTSEIVFENKVDAEKASVKNIIKWNYDNGKQVMVMVNLITPERSRSERDSNEKVVNSNVLYINPNKQLGDNAFYLQNSNFNNVTPSHPVFNSNAFDLSQLNNLVNCASLTPIYQQPFQFSNIPASFYSTQHYNNVAIQIPQYNSYDINDKTLQSVSAINNAIPVQYPFSYQQYNAYANPLPFGIPLMYAPLNNNYPVKTAYDKSVNPAMKPDYLYNPNKSLARNSYVVYVYNIGNTTTKEQLKELFAQKFAKEIIKVDVPKDAQNGSNKNFGFVTFGNFHKAQLAIQEMNGKEFQGKPLQVSFKK